MIAEYSLLYCHYYSVFGETNAVDEVFRIPRLSRGLGTVLPSKALSLN
jgi:hypothetical protein